MPIATLNFNYVVKRTINYIYDNCLCFTALQDECTIGWHIYNTLAGETNTNVFVISYSTDNGYSWNTIVPSQEFAETGSFATIDAGKNLLIRGFNTTLEGFRFTSDKTFNLSGSILSLLYSNIGNVDELEDNCFTGSGNRGIFSQTKVVDASSLQLPDFTSENCYTGMFYGCTSLTNAPELPATELSYGCYTYMFYGCTSLANAPELSATSLAVLCYAGMFYGCTNLDAAPALPATTLANNCYTQMFYRCTSLTIAPGLPATTLANNCYDSMFNRCTSLIQPPALPATTLASNCYLSMFQGCTSITYAPHLPADTIPSGAYANMFKDCTSLNYINISATQRESSSLTNWVNNVAPTGTFVKHPNATYDIDSVNGVPIGWTIYNESDYVPQTYTITIDINNDAWGSVTGSGTYVEGTTVTLQAYPNAGYNFVCWNNGGQITSNNPISFTLQEDVHLTAVFEETPVVPNTYTVNLLTIGSSTGYTLTGTGTYTDDDLVRVDVIRDADTSVTTNFAGWYILTGGAYELYSEDKFFTFNIHENKTFYAEFVDIPPVYYNVYAGLDTDSLGYGAVTGTGTYADGNNATVNATPNTGYEFVYWRIDDQYNVTDNPYTFNVTKDTQLLAYIRPIVEQYELVIENNDPWHTDIIVQDEGRLLYGDKIIDDYEDNAQIEQVKYSVSENATVTLTAQNKYVDLLEFDGWYAIDDEYITTLISTEQEYSFVMNGPMKICCKWKTIEPVDETDYSQEYFTITALEDCAVYADIILYRHHQNSLGRWIHYTAVEYTLEYSINGGEWQQKDIAKSDEDSTTETTVQVANLAATDKMRIRCVMPWEYSVGGNKYIIKHVTLRTASIEKDQYDIWPLREIPCRISGNLMSLVYGSNFLNSNTLGYNYLRFPFDLRNIFDAYNVVFPILSDPSLNANWENRATYYSNWESYIDFDKDGNEVTKSDGRSYDGTYYYWPGRFSGILSNNTYMIKGPKSIGTNTYEGDYKGLLQNNHNLYNAPLCPAEIIAPMCYDSMLRNCHSLQQPVPVLPALELQSFCYNRMYERCYMIQDPGTLPANTLAPYSYQYMYAGCRSMMTGPEIPIETLNIANAASRFHLMLGDCINMSFLEVHFKYREGGDFGLGYFLGYPEWYKEDQGGDDPEEFAKEHLARMPQKPGRFYRYANTAIDSNTGMPWMSRESLAWYGTEFPDNWTFEDIPT